jgi:hypothetical protein
MPAPSSPGSATGLVLTFDLPRSSAWPAHPDIDNLCEPVFATVINRLGWFGGRRPNLVWFVALKRPSAEPGATISVMSVRAPAKATVVDPCVFEARWSGPPPRSARDQGFIAWVREQRPPVVRGSLAVALEFGDLRVNIGDVATGPVKSLIDCLQPIIGGRPGNPDDHRITRLLVAKGVADLAHGTVRISMGGLP